MKLWEFLPEFAKALEEQLKDDDKRWGDTWLERKRDGQEERTFYTYLDYFQQYKNAGIPVPWLKIAGGALICWVRENHPELWSK